MAALKAALQKEMCEALEETVEDSYLDLKDHLNHFYDAEEGKYKRTGQLRDSGQIDGINFNGDSAVGQLSISTHTQYDPSGRDTATIYGYGNSGGLLGNPGFWDKTEDDIEKNIDRNFGKRFSN